MVPCANLVRLCAVLLLLATSAAVGHSRSRSHDASKALDVPPPAPALSDSDPYALSTFSDLPSEQRTASDERRSEQQDFYDRTPPFAPLNRPERLAALRKADAGLSDGDMFAAAGEEQDTDFLQLDSSVRRAAVGLSSRIEAAEEALRRADAQLGTSTAASTAASATAAATATQGQRVPPPAVSAPMLDEPVATAPADLDQPDHSPQALGNQAAMSADQSGDGMDDGDGDGDGSGNGGDGFSDGNFGNDADYNSGADGRGTNATDADSASENNDPLPEDGLDPDNQDDEAAAKVPSGSYTRLTLDNANTVKEPKKKSSKHEELMHEEAVKKATETGKKHSQEQSVKLERSTRLQMTTIEKRKISQEQENKKSEDDIQQRGEQFTKKARERQEKQDDRLYHKLREANSKESNQKKAYQREQILETAREQAQESTNKVEQELTRKQVQEQVMKVNAKHKEAAEKEHQKYIVKAQKEHLVETKQKHEDEIGVKAGDEKAQKKNVLTQERQEKHSAKLKEHNEKQREKQQEEEGKQAARTQTGTWCGCDEIDVNFGEHNRWFKCPEGKLLTGIYRDSSSQYVTAIKKFQCCNPCRGGTAPLKLRACERANWYQSFDREGWSMCPSHKFITGLYKSDNNFIYNIEYAECCAISGSRGTDTGTCAQKNEWMYSLDGQGWSMLDKDYFLTGLFRSGGNWLFNIEFPKQCKFYAFAVVS